jgi:sugar lactone lactonase YvrE
VYRINGSGPSTTLSAVSGSPFLLGGTFTQGLALNRAGAFLFVTNSISRSVTTYSVDAATGALNAANV